MSTETARTPHSLARNAIDDQTYTDGTEYIVRLVTPHGIEFQGIGFRIVDAQSERTDSPSPDQSQNALYSLQSIVDEENPNWEEIVSAAEERLKEAVEEALDEDGQKPTDAAMVGACDMLDVAPDLITGHDAETYATSSGDVIIDVTDYRSNYVVFKNKAAGKVAVHYNINGYKEFANQGEVDKSFVRSMLSALQRNSATP